MIFIEGHDYGVLQNSKVLMKTHAKIDVGKSTTMHNFFTPHTRQLVELNNHKLL